MKKFFLLLMALMMALTTLTAFAEDAVEAPEIYQEEGFVMELLDGSILIQTSEGKLIEALLNDNTAFEGKEPAVGDLVQVLYFGMMTRSIPAQINAEAVLCNMLMGVVSDLSDGSFLLTYGEEIFAVNADASLLEGIQDGMFITLYHNGMMTRSIPPMVTALHIRGQEIVGTVTEMAEGGFILTVEGEEIPYHVALKDGAMQFVTAEPGMEVVVIIDGVQTSSLESILVSATEILPLNTAAKLYDMAGTVTEIDEGFILIETAEGEEIQVNTGDETIFEGKEIAIGDFIHVTHNGQMTMSIPAQIFGLKVGCYVHVGSIIDIIDGQFVLKTETDTIVVNTDSIEGLEVGQNVYVYSNGAMTMSLPAQIGAELIVIRSR